MKLTVALAPMLIIALACSGGSSDGMSDDEAEKIAEELVKAAEEAEKEAAKAAEDAVEDAGKAVDAADDAVDAADDAKDATDDAKDAADDAKAGDDKDAEADEAKEEEVKKTKVTTTIKVPIAEKATIKPKAKKAIIAHAKSKGFSRVDDVETSETCSAGSCNVTVTGWASK